jgi:DNA repair exonuclease SbcCD ATPase subunit
LEQDLEREIGAGVRRFELKPEDYPVHVQRIDSGRKLVDTLKQTEQGADAEVTELENRLLGLTAAKTTLDGWRNRVTTRADLLWKRTAHEAILQRRSEIEQQAARLEELTRMLPPLNDWREARKSWRDAQQRYKQAADAIGTIETGSERLVSESKAALQAQEDADECFRTAIATAVQAKNAFEALDQRLLKLQDAQGKPECIVCGQPLSPGHIEKEIGELENQIQTARARAEHACEKRDAADKARKAAGVNVTTLGKRIEVEGRSHTKAIGSRDLAEGDSKHAKEKAERALRDLQTAADNLAKLLVAGEPYVPERVLQRLLSAPDGDLAETLLHGTYPSDQDMDEMKAEKAVLEGADRELQALNAARKEAGQLEAEISGYEMQIQTDEGTLAQAAQNTDLTALLEAKAIAENAIAEEIARFPRLGAISDLNEQQRKAKEALAHVRTGAEKPVVEAKHEIDQCQKAKEDSKKLRDDARGHHGSLSRLLGEYGNTVNEHTETARQAKVHRTLEQKLDRYNLQSYLRAAAEQAIVGNADAILQRLSDGMLYLSLQPGTGRTLDLRVMDYEKGRREMLPAALSGSQKFRVSVALALGIGQYACGLSQGGVKSVIIDEGFGSLDKEGREKMIEELHNLGRMLERIIVVSHQEEFESAFSHRWHISVQGGTAQAEMMA